MQACLCVLVTLLCVRYCIDFEQDVNDMVTFSTTSVCTRDIRLVICCHIVLFLYKLVELLKYMFLFNYYTFSFLILLYIAPTLTSFGYRMV